MNTALPSLKNLILKLSTLFTLLVIFIANTVDTQAQNRPFITTWETTTANETITISTGLYRDLDIMIDWGDGTVEPWVNFGDPSHTYDPAGTYTVEISGVFPSIQLNNSTSATKLMSIEQWGDIEWQSFTNAFYGASNMVYNATDAPNLSLVTNMRDMFRDASSFNGDISSWDVSNVIDMGGVFRDASSFNGDISNWDVSNATNMVYMFFGASAFNQDLNNWDVSSVTAMAGLFKDASAFNGRISNWDVNKVTNMAEMFSGAMSFNQDINEKITFNVRRWNVRNVTSMKDMFKGAISFNRDIRQWGVNNVINMSGMFSGATSFNQDIGRWDVSNVVYMSNMFSGATAFNQDIGSWVVRNVTSMGGMFSGASSFNQNLNSWSVFNVTNMNEMFSRAISFNQDLSRWQLSNVIYMKNMFFGATAFDQNLGSWQIRNAQDLNGMFDSTNVSTANYDATLIGWSSRLLRSNVTIGVSGLQYCVGRDARQTIIDNYNWTFSGDELVSCLIENQLVSPEITETVEPPVDLIWNMTHNPVGYEYEFQLSATEDFSEVLVSQTKTDFDTTYNFIPSIQIDFSNNYYWRVRSVGTINEEDSTEWVQRELNVEIVNPELTTEQGVEFNEPFQLEWTGDLREGAYVYLVEISEYSDFREILKDSVVSTNLIDLGFSDNLNNNDLHYWRVKKAAVINTAYSSDWVGGSFNVAFNQVAAPSLISPQNSSSVGLPVELSWESGNDENLRLRLQLSTDEDFNTIIQEEVFPFVRNQPAISSITLNSLNENRSYYWRLRNENVDNPNDFFSSWNTRQFFVTPEFIRLQQDSIATAEPNYVNIRLHALDENNRGITGLDKDSFELLENDRAISTTESNYQISKLDQVPYTLQTVMMLDNSLSIGENNLEFIKAGAREFVRNLVPNQEVALFSFADNRQELLPFTSDTTALLAAIDNISLTQIPGTDLYSAAILGLQQWENSFTLSNINEGFMLLFTDGRDLAGRESLESVITERGNKQVYAVGVVLDPNDFDEAALRSIGNGGTFIESGFESLIERFAEVQQRIQEYADSFYWLNYASASRSANTELTVRVKGNTNSDADAQIIGNFNASNFYAVPRDIIIEGSAENPIGVNQITMAGDDTLEVKIETIFAYNLFPFQFNVSDSQKLSIVPHESKPFVYLLQGDAEDGDQITVTVTDVVQTTLDLEKVLTVDFTERETPTSTDPEPENQLPKVFSLAQNYPNPFNPTTNISFDVPQASNVRLEVYDMLGRKVASLVNERKSVGTHTVTFDASNLSSGMYIYRLEAGNFVQTKKLTLIK